MKHRAVARLIVGISMFACFARVASAQPASPPPTEEQLRIEIAQLQSQIDPLVAGRLGDPASVRVDLSAAPVSRVFAYVNTLPLKQREVSYDMTSATGGIAHFEDECKVWFVSIGSIGGWANFEDVNGGGFWLTLQHAAATWNPGQGALNLAISVTGYARIPTIHTRVKPVCFLPAFGGPDIGPIDVRNINANSNSAVTLTRGTAQLFTVNASLGVNGALEACTRVIFFDLCLPFNFSGNFAWSGDVGGPVQQDGEVGIPIGHAIVRKKFTLDLTNRNASTTNVGFRIVVAPAIVWR